jgi:hypothetical protein
LWRSASSLVTVAVGLIPGKKPRAAASASGTVESAEAVVYTLHLDRDLSKEDDQ